jgi:large subunit ribosomal protein L14
LGSNTKSMGKVGDNILARVIKKTHSKKLKKKTMYFGLIILVKYFTKRLDGTILKFNANRVLLFSFNYKFLGTRVYGPISKNLRFYLSKNKGEKQKYLKILSYADTLI